MAALSRELLKIIACPSCKSTLSYNEKLSSLTCTGCRLEFKVQDGIPILLVDEAQNR